MSLHTKIRNINRSLRNPELATGSKARRQLVLLAEERALTDTLLMTKKLVKGFRPPYLDDGDVVKALDKSSTRVDSLLAEADRRLQGAQVSEAEYAELFVYILLERFLHAAMEVAGHKATSEHIREWHGEGKLKEAVSRCAAHLQDAQ